VKPLSEILAGDAALEERLRTHLSLLRRWNVRINLAAEAPEEVLWQRHTLDSLQLLPLLPEAAGRLVDLGSGGGFPGLVLAAATGWPTALVESDRRKAAFLAEAARAMALPHVTIHAGRIEALSPLQAEVITARALAPLTVLVGHAHRHLAPGGIALFPKGRTAAEELTAATAAWTMRVERFPSRTDPAATILRLGDIRPARTPD